MKSRYIKTIIFTSLNDIRKIEKVINNVSHKINSLGGKVISIVPHSWGISPMNLIYDIIYESEKAFVDEDFEEDNK